MGLVLLGRIDSGVVVDVHGIKVGLFGRRVG